MFSERTRWDLRPNRLAERLAAKRATGAHVLDLTLSNPTQAGLPIPGDILAPLASPEGRRYEPSAFGLPSAREAVAADFARRGFPIGPDRVLLSASTSEAYAFLFKLLCDPGDEVLVPRPGYPLFEFLAALESLGVRAYPLAHDGEWHLDVSALRAAVSPRTRAVVVVNPNNPTGAYLKEDELLALEALCAERRLALVSDEVFADFSFRDDARRASSVARDSPALAFALGGLSKSCGLPQLKLAWTAVTGPEPLRREALARLEVVADTFLSVSTPVQLAAPALRRPARGAAGTDTRAGRPEPRPAPRLPRPGLSGDAPRARGRLVRGPARAGDPPRGGAGHATPRGARRARPPRLLLRLPARGVPRPEPARSGGRVLRGDVQGPRGPRAITGRGGPPCRLRVLHSRGVVVTGGTGALGRALVRVLVDGGARVAVPFRGEAEWRALQEEIGASPALFGAAADLADPSAARAFLDEAASRLGTLDGLALTAGAWRGGTSFDAAPLEEWPSMLRTNLDTVANACRAALPHLRKAGGSVVAVGSRAAEQGGAGMAAYAVSKVAVHALVRVLALENAAAGVRFNAVLPGTIDTPANRRAMPDADRSKWTSPEAIARVMAFLLSPASAPTTGALVPVDAPA